MGCKLNNSMEEKKLDELLKQAFENESQRPLFLEKLLDSYVYILGSSSVKHDGDIAHTLMEGSQVHIKSWNREDGSQVLPFFTSLEKLQHAIQHNENYLRLHTKSFFELTTGAYLVLNPNSDVSKEFYPKEVEGLLEGYFGPKPEAYEYTEDTQVLLSQPLPYPVGMVSRLSELLKTKVNVSAAYLAQMHDVKRDPELTLVIGLTVSIQLTEQERKDINAQVGQMAFDTLVDKKAVDLMFIDQSAEDGLSHYFLNETPPFYVRQKERKKGFFAKLFS